MFLKVNVKIYFETPFIDYVNEVELKSLEKDINRAFPPTENQFSSHLPTSYF